MKKQLLVGILLLIIASCAPAAKQEQIMPKLAPTPAICQALPDFSSQELQTGLSLAKTNNSLEAWYFANIQGSTHVNLALSDGRIMYDDGYNWGYCVTEFYPQEQTHTVLLGTIHTSLRSWTLRAENTSAEQRTFVNSVQACLQTLLESKDFGNGASFDDNNAYRLKQASDECRKRK